MAGEINCEHNYWRNAGSGCRVAPGSPSLTRAAIFCCLIRWLIAAPFTAAGRRPGWCEPSQAALVFIRVESLLGRENFGTVGACVTCHGLPLRGSGRASHLSRDSDPPAPDCLALAPRFGWGACTSDGERSVTRRRTAAPTPPSQQSACAWRVRGGAGQTRGRCDAGFWVARPAPGRAPPVITRAGWWGKIQSGTNSAWRPLHLCLFGCSFP